MHSERRTADASPPVFRELVLLSDEAEDDHRVVKVRRRGVTRPAVTGDCTDVPVLTRPSDFWRFTKED